ncbi:hypothetical protein DRW42_21240 [Pedobacter miscanthi]|uniref:Uncharacterized protein n=1 Tax=Pedobacter miscanthi TaxID=2259170 RepID=A0A366KPD8_9SPHI|nr:hypothetical protein DRW42_21240 [Pedobacter miscanthi]
MSICIAHTFPPSQAIARYPRSALFRPNKFFGFHWPSQTTGFQRKIFSRRFLVLFDVKKKELFGGGEPRRECTLRQKNQLYIEGKTLDLS